MQVRRHIRRLATIATIAGLSFGSAACERTSDDRAGDAQTCLAIALICTSFSTEEQAQFLPGCIAVQLGNSGACFGR